MFYVPVVKLPLANGDVKCLRLPATGDDDAVARRLFNEAAEAIASEWDVRKPRVRGQRRDWLMRACYPTICVMLENGFEHILADRIARFGRGTRGKRASNPFQQGLMAIFAEDREEKLLKGGDRQDLGARMWHAFRHYVPSQFVAGFSMEYFQRENPTLEPNIEPELLEWVIAHRAQDEQPSVRGRYDPEVEDSVVRIRSVMGPVVQVEANKLLRAQRKRG